jgi:hypothetical protein
LTAVKACCEARNKQLPTELMLLTDGDIWSQQQMFDYISEQTKSGDIRVFPIGIGGGVSSALIEGVARAGRGFAQMVTDNEKLEAIFVTKEHGCLGILRVHQCFSSYFLIWIHKIDEMSSR